MKEGYVIRDQTLPHFITATVVDWIDVPDRADLHNDNAELHSLRPHSRSRRSTQRSRRIAFCAHKVK